MKSKHQLKTLHSIVGTIVLLFWLYMGYLHPVRQKYDLDMPFIRRLNMVYVDVYECPLEFT